MMRTSRAIRLIVMCGLLVAAHARAVPITFFFTGSVTDDPFGLSSFGAPISGSYTFESAATDAIAGASAGSYPSVGPGFGFTANVDGTSYSLFGSLVVNTANDIGVDQYGAIATDASLTLEVFFQDATQTALSSDELPLVPPPIGAFNDFRQFRLFSAEAEFLGTINTLVCSTGCNGNGGGNGGGTVPEPATLWLFALATLALALRRLQIS